MNLSVQQADASVLPAGRRAQRKVHVERNKLAELALASLFGTAFDHHYPEWPHAAWLMLLLASLAAVVTRRFLWFCTLIATCSLFAIWHHQANHVVPADHVSRFGTQAGQILKVRGEIVSEVRVRAQPARYQPNELAWQTDCVIKIEEVAQADGWQSARGRVALRIYERADLARGDLIEAIGEFKRPGSNSNPGEFDYRAWLARQSIYSTMQVERANAISTRGSTTFTKLSWWMRRIDQLRTHISSIFDQYLDSRDAPLVDALVTGNRGQISRDELNSFFHTGTMHLLVVSGMHVVLLWTMISPIATLANMSLRNRSKLVWLIFPAYALLTGGEAPIVRATIAVCLAASAMMLSRRTTPIAGVGLAVLLIQAHDPNAFMQAGTQLSFVAVLAIHLLMPKRLQQVSWFEPQPGQVAPSMLDEVDPSYSRITYWLTVVWDAVYGSALISLLMVPMVVTHFAILSPITILVGPLLIPLFTALLVMGMLLIALGSWSSILGTIMAFPIGLVVRMIRSVLEYSDQQAGGFLSIPPIPMWWTMGFYILLLAPRIISALYRWNIWFRYLTVLWIIVAGGMIIHPTLPTVPEVHQLDVGHGNCTIIRMPSGHVVMYDCGSLFGSQIADRTIVPWFWHHGIGRVDLLIVSHADVDHFSGLAGVLQQLNVRRVMTNRQLISSQEPAMMRLNQEMVKLGVNQVPWLLTESGDRIELSGASILIRQPASDDVFDSDNAHSIVADVSFESGQRMLMTGDLEGRGMQRFIEQATMPPVGLTKLTELDLLVCPHHGARRNNTRAFAQAVRPRLVLCSNQTRDLSREALRVYQEVGSKILRTDQTGAITCRLNRDGSIATSTFHVEAVVDQTEQ